MNRFFENNRLNTSRLDNNNLFWQNYIIYQSLIYVCNNKYIIENERYNIIKSNSHFKFKLLEIQLFHEKIATKVHSVKERSHAMQ